VTTAHMDPNYPGTIIIRRYADRGQATRAATASARSSNGIPSSPSAYQILPPAPFFSARRNKGVTSQHGGPTILPAPGIADGALLLRKLDHLQATD
jgi:hypothetical protein